MRREQHKVVQGQNLDIRWASLFVEASDYNSAVNHALRVETEIKLLLKREEGKRNYEIPNSVETNSRKRSPEKKTQLEPSSKKFQENPKVNYREKCGYCGNPSHNGERCWRKQGKCVVVEVTNIGFKNVLLRTKRICTKTKNYSQGIHTRWKRRRPQYIT